MNIEHLIDSARQMAGVSAKKPRQTDLRRAVSNAYYAMFHTLASLNANQLAGPSRRGTVAWSRIYRALDHKKAKDELQRKDVKLISVEIDQFALLFTQLQELRHQADYDPNPFTPNKQQVLSLIAQAESAISGLDALSSDQRAQLATFLLLKARN